MLMMHSEGHQFTMLNSENRKMLEGRLF